MMTESPNPEPTPGNKSILRTLAGPAVVLVVLVILGRYAGGYWPRIEEAVSQMGPLGYLVFSFSYALLSCACFPVSVLGFSAGVLFGPWLGLALVAVGGLVGGILQFLLGRSLLRRRIQEVVAHRPKLAAVDRMAGRQDIKLNILTRLSPLNFGLAGYTLASGRSRFRAYLAGLAASLPSMIVQVWFGFLARDAGSAVADEAAFPVGRALLLAGGVLFFALLSWQVGRMVRQAMNEETDPDDEAGADG